MHPWVVSRPIDHGSLVPWIAYAPYERRIRYAPMGLSGPGGTTRRGWSIVFKMLSGTIQVGLASFERIVNGPTGLGASSVPMPTAQVRSDTSSPGFAFVGKTYMRISGMFTTRPRYRERGRIQRDGTTTSAPGGGIHSSIAGFASRTS